MSSFHANTDIEGKFEYVLDVFHGRYCVTIVHDGLVDGAIARRSDRKIVVALVRSYISEYRPNMRVHILTLHSSLAAAKARAKESPQSIHTFISTIKEAKT